MRHYKLIATLALAISCTIASAQTDSSFFIRGSMGRLAAELRLPELNDGEKCPVVIICHGFMGNMDSPLLTTIADNLVEAGIGALRFDFNGHGRSEGDFVNMTVPNEIDDALAVVAFAVKDPRISGISILGHSQGGVVAAMIAGQLGKDIIRSVVLLAPAAVLRDDALRGNTMGASYDPWHTPEYVEMPFGLKLGRSYIQTAMTLPIYETASRYDGPALVIHGMADRVVPYTYGERFSKEMPSCKLTLIPGEDHGFSGSIGQTAAMASEWLAGTLD